MTPIIGSALGHNPAMTREPRVVVCLPTYDEAANVEPMVRALGAALDPSRDRVLVIDDSSPDGTGAIARRLAEELDWVEVIERPGKEGIGPAYRDGFRHALAAGAEIVVQIDCDFSHDPGDLPRLLAPVESGAADVALGSRYAEGGGTENWGLVRRAISAGGCLYARVVLGVPVRDLTGGFKCMRADVVRRLDLERVSARGYGFQIEVTYRALRDGFRVVEVPIRFVDREVGRSKMSRAVVVEALWLVPALRLRALTHRL
jgi:dolichol-phosphate mannosyltransferase